MLPGRPSVDLVRQFVHICGTSWTHHRTVPMVPRTLAATGMDDWGAMIAYVGVFVICESLESACRRQDASFDTAALCVYLLFRFESWNGSCVGWQTT